MIIDVLSSEDGYLDVETTDGSPFSEKAIVLVLDALDVNTLDRSGFQLIVPVSAGAALLRELLTPDQWDAVTCA